MVLAPPLLLESPISTLGTHFCFSIAEARDLASSAKGALVLPNVVGVETVVSEANAMMSSVNELGVAPGQHDFGSVEAHMKHCSDVQMFYVH